MGWYFTLSTWELNLTLATLFLERTLNRSVSKRVEIRLNLPYVFYKKSLNVCKTITVDFQPFWEFWMKKNHPRKKVLHQTEPTRLQNLALQLSQRLNNLTENNERLCESKQGSNFSAFYSSKSNNHKGKNSGTTKTPRISAHQHQSGQSRNYNQHNSISHTKITLRH